MSAEIILRDYRADNDSPDLDFDFDSTRPPLWRITTRSRKSYNGIWAVAEFVYGFSPCLRSLVVWAVTGDEALEKLLKELERYQ